MGSQKLTAIVTRIYFLTHQSNLCHYFVLVVSHMKQLIKFTTQHSQLHLIAETDSNIINLPWKKLSPATKLFN